MRMATVRLQISIYCALLWLAPLVCSLQAMEWNRRRNYRGTHVIGKHKRRTPILQKYGLIATPEVRSIKSSPAKYPSLPQAELQVA
jgi:hypothetical protein